MYLLDVNVLIALVDPWHPFYASAVPFFKQAIALGWATCPLTENGFLRIHGHPNYSNGPGSADVARRTLNAYLMSPGHQFWPDDISLCDAGRFPTLPGSKSLADVYLLALAVKRGGRFATFDRGVDSSLVKGGDTALYLIPA